MVLAQPLPGAGSEADRIQRARLGDSTALEELITSHRTFVEHVARRYVADRDDIEDITQEAWIKATAALTTLRDDSRFRPWLRAITRNACLTFLARRQPSDSLDAEDAEEPAGRAADGPEASAELRDERRRMWEALGALPELDRRALYLREVESLPFEEVARRLGVRRNAAEVRVHRARTRFRQLYEAADATPPACGMAGIRLALLLDGELHGGPADAVETHLRACADCAQRIRTMARGRSLYRRLGMFALPGFSGLLERFQRGVDAVMRWVPADAAPVLAGNSSAPAAVVTSVTTAIVAAAVIVAPGLVEPAQGDFVVKYTAAPPAAAIVPAGEPSSSPALVLVSPGAVATAVTTPATAPVVTLAPAKLAAPAPAAAVPIEIEDLGAPSEPAAPGTSGTSPSNALAVTAVVASAPAATDSGTASSAAAEDKPATSEAAKEKKGGSDGKGADASKESRAESTAKVSSASTSSRGEDTSSKSSGPALKGSEVKDAGRGESPKSKDEAPRASAKDETPKATKSESSGAKRDDDAPRAAAKSSAAAAVESKPAKAEPPKADPPKASSKGEHQGRNEPDRGPDKPSGGKGKR